MKDKKTMSLSLLFADLLEAAEDYTTANCYFNHHSFQHQGM